MDAPVGLVAKGDRGEAVAIEGYSCDLKKDINIQMFKITVPEENW